MLSERDLRNLMAEVLREISRAGKEGDDERAKRLMNVYNSLAELLAEVEEKKRLQRQFLEDLRSVVEEPPRREGEGEEEIEERREFARRLYEMAERGLEEEDILLRKNSVRGMSAIRKAIEALRLAKQRVSTEWLEWKMLHRIDWEEAERRKEDFIWDEIIRELQRIGVEQTETELLGGETVREVRLYGDARYLNLTAPDTFREEVSKLMDCLRHLRSEAEDRSSVRACVEVLKDCIRIVNDMADRLAVKASENTLRAFRRIADALNRLGRRAEEWLMENAPLTEQEQFLDEREERQ